MRTRGDVVVQFQWMREPFRTPESREELRVRIVDAVPWSEITPDRVSGRPTIPLMLLIDDAVRSAFLEVFGQQVERTRQATKLL